MKHRQSPIAIARAASLNALIERSVQTHQLNYSRDKHNKPRKDDGVKRLYGPDVDKLCSLLNIGPKPLALIRRGYDVNPWVNHRVEVAMSLGAQDYESLCEAMRRHKAQWWKDERGRFLARQAKEIIRKAG